MAKRSKAWVCGHPLPRADHSSRGVLLIVVWPMSVTAKTLRQGNESKSGSSPIVPHHTHKSNKRKGKLSSSVMSLFPLPWFAADFVLSASDKERKVLGKVEDEFVLELCTIQEYLTL